MKCAELEGLICDYVEATLSAVERQLVEAHLQSCEACRALVRDARAALAFTRKAPPVEPPPELLTRLLFLVPSHCDPGAAQASGARARVAAWFRPILQPRFAMGMAMTILSVSIVARVAGITPRQLTPTDLHPARVWQAVDDKVHRVCERVRKFYLSLRLVYEIQTQLHEWSQQLREQDAAAAARDSDAPVLPSRGPESNAFPLSQDQAEPKAKGGTKQ